MSKTVSARIQNKRHEELRERCNKVGCTMNEFIEHAIEFAIDGSTEFDFGDEEEEEFEDEQSTKNKPVPAEIRAVKVE